MTTPTFRDEPNALAWMSSTRTVQPHAYYHPKSRFEADNAASCEYCARIFSAGSIQCEGCGAVRKLKVKRPTTSFSSCY